MLTAIQVFLSDTQQPLLLPSQKLGWDELDVVATLVAPPQMAIHAHVLCMAIQHSLKWAIHTFLQGGLAICRDIAAVRPRAEACRVHTCSRC